MSDGLFLKSEDDSEKSKTWLVISSPLYIDDPPLDCGPWKKHGFVWGVVDICDGKR